MNDSDNVGNSVAPSQGAQIPHNDARQRLPEQLINTRRWLLWTEDKQPFYPNGTPRNGSLDTPADVSRLGTFDQALDALVASGEYAGIGFALGYDGLNYWQGFDADKLTPAQVDAAISSHDDLGYMEVSPSGRGIHVIGYGRSFKSLGANGTNVEAYAGGRYFTFTGDRGRGQPSCIAAFVEGAVAARHAHHGRVPLTEQVIVDPKLVTELRSALAHMRAEDYQLWIAMGHALRELGDVGRGLWWDWSQTSPKCKSEDAKRWDTFKPVRTGYQAVFAAAQARGWVNPASNAARIADKHQSSGDFQFKFARPGETILDIDYLIDPWLPRATVIGCYGRGEAGKSSWTAQICAKASGQVSTLWISSEERQDHILQRHLSCCGEVDSLAVIQALPTKIDPVSKKAVATSFNVYEHMENALIAFQKQARPDRPLGIVVLDAVVALVTWEKGERPNDDAGVKKLIANLFTLSERYGVTFIMLGHLNKGTDHEHMADAVTGAAAWTNSVRLAFMFAKDMTSDSYEGFIRTVKSNTGTAFGAQYKTVPVYTLKERPDGKNDVLCGVTILGPVVWGELALREMMAEDDDRWLNRREQKRQKVQLVVDCVIQSLRNGPTTRKAVEVMLGAEKVSRRHWQAVDQQLQGYGVQIQNDAHNEHIYWPPKTT